jgi:hypothetical protein
VLIFDYSVKNQTPAIGAIRYFSNGIVVFQSCAGQGL